MQRPGSLPAATETGRIRLVPPGGADAIRIALLLPLSGQNAAIGRALLDAAQLALFDAAQDRLTLLVRDTEGNPETAARAAEDALAAGAELILGPLFAAEVQAVAPVARARGVAVLAFSTDRSVAGNGTYLLGFTPEQQVEQVVLHARAAGIERFAAMVPEGPYGQATEGALRAALEKSGGTLVKVGSYPPETADFTPLIRRFADYDRRRAALQTLKQQLAEKGDEASRQQLAKLSLQDTLGDPDFQAILLPEGGPRLRALAPVLAYFDIDPAQVKYLGTGQWDQPGLGNEPSLLGGWFAAPPPDYAENFRKRFESAYNRRPPRIASLAYDATALAAALAADGGERRFSNEQLGNRQGFSGFDGIFRFAPNGVAERGLAILEVQRNGVKAIRAAPETFEQVGQ